MADSGVAHVRSPSVADEVITERVPFPEPESEEFKDDPRVSYSKVDQKWILEDDDGSEWQYDEHQKKWIEMVSNNPVVCYT